MSGVTTRHMCCLIILCYAPLTGCGQQVVLHAPNAYPQRLSDWHMVWRDGNSLAIHPEAQVYDLNTPLFSDYALKLRTLYLPGGKAATWHATESFDFPVGTIVTKTFFYAIRADAESSKADSLSGDSLSGHTSYSLSGHTSYSLSGHTSWDSVAKSLTRHTSWDGAATKINFDDFHVMETRVLVRQSSGWDALPYIWNGDDALLAITGKVVQANLDGEDFAYLVPSRNECSSCHITNHTAKQLQPIGLKARHLNRAAPSGGVNQLVAMSDLGWLPGLPETARLNRNAAMHDSTASVDARARAYLDINCGHCHSAHGAADTSGLLLDSSIIDARQIGRCKPSIAAGHGSGGRTFGIVLWRIQTTDPGARMPELGRSLMHIEGVELVRQWIADQPAGAC